jgi:hypothetical protein
VNATVAVAKEFIHTPLAGTLALAFSIVATLICFFNMFLHLNNYTRPKLQKFTVRCCLLRAPGAVHVRERVPARGCVCWLVGFHGRCDCAAFPGGCGDSHPCSACPPPALAFRSAFAWSYRFTH